MDSKEIKLPPKKYKKREHTTQGLSPTLTTTQIQRLAQKYLFTEQEISLTYFALFYLDSQKSFQIRFDNISEKGVLNRKQFRDSLGILGIESFLSDRIFSLIDVDNDEKVSFEDFICYISILLNGSGVEKALWNFKLLSNGKPILELEDLQQMILELCYLWNSMTSSQTVPHQEFVQEIFSMFDEDDDGIVTFEDFNAAYKERFQMQGWFEFLNNDDFTIQKVHEIERETDNRRQTLRRRPDFQSKTDLLKARMNEIREQLKGCLELIQNERQNLAQTQQVERDQLLNFYKSVSNIVDKTRGPLYNCIQVEQIQGDDDEIENEETLSKNKSVSSQFTQLTSNKFQVLVMNKLKEVMRLSEEIKALNRQNQDQQQKSELLESRFEQEARRKNSFIVSGLIQGQEVRKNLSVYFGHENWNLVLNMMVGIRKAIKNLHPLNDNVQFNENHFNMKYQFEIVTKRTEYQIIIKNIFFFSDFDFRKTNIFYEYAPMVFERIRKSYGVTNEDYLRSVGPEQLLGDLLFGNLSSLTEKVSSGKSGSFFYYSFDDKYMFKTISKDEYIFFKKIIKRYYDHLMKNFNSMIIKIFGLYKMKIFKSKSNYDKIYFVVMVNIFCTELLIRERYDLKGSFYGRTSREKNQPPPDINIPLKDLDWVEDKRKINLNSISFNILIDQIHKDVLFFEQNRIIDYSFLIGYIPLKGQYAQIPKKTDKTKTKQQNIRFYENDYGGVLSSDREYIYMFGIIDIFTEYNKKKQMEHNLKSTFVSKEISCVPPEQYGERFKNFLLQYIIK